MKVILSHDVDHLQGAEHWRDHYWPGVWFRGIKSFLTGNIGSKTLALRSWPFQRLEQIREVVEIDRAVGARSSFFFGMRKGLRLSYSYKSLVPYLDYLKSQDARCYVHGMSYLNEVEMCQEYEVFKHISGYPPRGIRNHYLRKGDETQKLIAAIGYEFDSTDYRLEKPYQVGQLWEIPISLMDVSMGVDSSLEDKKKFSLETLERAQLAGIPYFVLNVHDNYISKGYPRMYDWYQWFVDYLSESLEFTDFEKALTELNG